MNGALMYRCGKCGELHLRYYDARDCCPPDVTKTWLCEACRSENWNKEEADACCPPEDPDSPDAVRRRFAELESAGQQRLIP